MSFIGVVLAGGQSTRMGTDKALLKANGKTMLSRLGELLSGAGACQVIVSRNGVDSEGIPDNYPGCGPLSGIQAVCARYPHSSLLFVPVDLPLLCEADLQQLVAAGEQAECLVRFKGNNLPFFINNTPLLTRALTGQLQMGYEFSVGKFCRQFPLLEIPQSDSLALFNSNTPAQWLFALSNMNNSNTLIAG